ncbi:MAG: response regulator [Reichenbachiella sp.]
MGKIIIADDSSFQRKILGDIISAIGHEVEAVESGQALLDKVASEKYDGICLDLLMPEMTGIEVLEKLQPMENVPPVIVISADIQVKKKEQCLALGAKAFVNKYIEKDSLEAVFKEHLINV